MMNMPNMNIMSNDENAIQRQQIKSLSSSSSKPKKGLALKPSNTSFTKTPRALG
jgi:hypothetical protein